MTRRESETSSDWRRKLIPWVREDALIFMIRLPTHTHMPHFLLLPDFTACMREPVSGAAAAATVVAGARGESGLSPRVGHQHQSRHPSPPTAMKSAAILSLKTRGREAEEIVSVSGAQLQWTRTLLDRHQVIIERKIEPVIAGSEREKESCFFRSKALHAPLLWTKRIGSANRCESPSEQRREDLRLSLRVLFPSISCASIGFAPATHVCEGGER